MNLSKNIDLLHFTDVIVLIVAKIFKGAKTACFKNSSYAQFLQFLRNL